MPLSIKYNKYMGEPRLAHPFLVSTSILFPKKNERQVVSHFFNTYIPLPLVESLLDH